MHHSLHGALCELLIRHATGTCAQMGDDSVSADRIIDANSFYCACNDTVICYIA